MPDHKDQVCKNCWWWEKCEDPGPGDCNIDGECHGQLPHSNPIVCQVWAPTDADDYCPEFRDAAEVEQTERVLRGEDPPFGSVTIRHDEEGTRRIHATDTTDPDGRHIIIPDQPCEIRNGETVTIYIEPSLRCKKCGHEGHPGEGMLCPKCEGKWEFPEAEENQDA